MNELTFSSLKLVKFSELLGKTLTAIDVDDIRITFTTTEGIYVQYHEQDCCEKVWFECHDGDIADLINSPINLADEVIVKKIDPDGFGESETSSFYKLATSKGSCTFTWRGESNGYYSETVSLFKVDN